MVQFRFGVKNIILDYQVFYKLLI